VLFKDVSLLCESTGSGVTQTQWAHHLLTIDELIPQASTVHLKPTTEFLSCRQNPL